MVAHMTKGVPNLIVYIVYGYKQGNQAQLYTV